LTRIGACDPPLWWANRKQEVLVQQQHGGQGTTQARSHSQAGQRTNETVYDQAKDAMSNVADRASELWDDAYDQGERYYREGSRAIGNMDGGTVALMLLVGTIGYALAWMIHGEQSYGRNWDASPGRGRRYRGDHNGSHRREYR